MERALATLAGIFLVGFLVASAIVYFSMSSKNSKYPVLTGTKWEAKTRDERNKMFDIEFQYGDQNRDTGLRANVKRSSTAYEQISGKYEGPKLEIVVKAEGGTSKITAEIDPTDPDVMHGEFPSKLANLKFTARKIQ